MQEPSAWGVMNVDFLPTSALVYVHTRGQAPVVRTENIIDERDVVCVCVCV